MVDLSKNRKSHTQPAIDLGPRARRRAWLIEPLIDVLRQIANRLGVRRRFRLAVHVRHETVRPNLPYVLVVCDEASHDHSSILGLNLCRELIGHYNVVALLLGAGDLVESFREDSNVLVGPYPTGEVNSVLAWFITRAICEQFPIDFAIINDLASRVVLKPLSQRYVASTLLVSKLDDLHCSPDELRNALLWAGQIAFASSVYRNSPMTGAIEGAVAMAHVLPEIKSTRTIDLGRLEAMSVQAKQGVMQLRMDVARLYDGDDFKDQIYIAPRSGMTRKDAIHEFSKGAQNRIYLRKPAAGFFTNVYASAKNHSHGVKNPFLDFIDRDKPSGPWQLQVIDVSERFATPKNDLRVAIHVHAFYLDVLISLLKNLREHVPTCDLFISIVEGCEVTDQVVDFSQLWPGPTVVRRTPNRGRDIGPFLTEFADELCTFDVVGHFHTKKSVHVENTDFVANWFTFLTENLIGGRYNSAQVILRKFAENPRLGMVFPDDPNMIGWDSNLEQAKVIARRLSLPPLPAQAFPFPVGTMFWARPNALMPLFALKLRWDEYPLEPIAIDGTFLHAIERILPLAAGHAGFEIQTTRAPKVRR